MGNTQRNRPDRAKSIARLRDSVAPMTSPQGTGSTPAGWYPDPGGSAQQRYWDGTQWTEHYAPAAGYPQQQPGYAQPKAPVGPAPSLWWAVPTLAVLTLIGCAGKWVAASFNGEEVKSETGLSGGDGFLTLVAVLIALGLMIGWRQNRSKGLAIGAAVLAAIAALFPLIYIIDPSSGAEAIIEPDWSRGWGLWPAFLGSLALSAVCAALATRREKPPVPGP
jgi:hypothetical protein